MTERVEPVRTLAAVTGSRADYALLRPVLQAIDAHPQLELRLYVTGAHLSAKHGSTVREIELDGFCRFETMDLAQSGDTPVDVTGAHARAVEGFGKRFFEERSDAVVLLGDRFETHAAATAAWISRLPIAHLHGGEVTEGSLDEAFRHGISKMASWHFVSVEDHARRLRQLGERDETIFVVGLTAWDAIAEKELPSRQDVERKLDLPPGARWFLVTYHPETAHRECSARALHAMSRALDAFPEFHVVVTHPNSDAGHEEILRHWEKERALAPDRIRLVPSLGSTLYLAVLRDAEACLGNSSSGVVEAPILGTWSVQVGDRQRGRARAESVVDCGAEIAEIRSALENRRRGWGRAFGGPGASKKIVDTLVEVIGRPPTLKRFRDWTP